MLVLLEQTLVVRSEVRVQSDPTTVDHDSPARVLVAPMIITQLRLDLLLTVEQPAVIVGRAIGIAFGLVHGGLNPSAVQVDRAPLIVFLLNLSLSGERLLLSVDQGAEA